MESLGTCGMDGRKGMANAPQWAKSDLARTTLRGQHRLCAPEIERGWRKLDGHVGLLVDVLRPQVDYMAFLLFLRDRVC
jgi:hypothetical protein